MFRSVGHSNEAGRLSNQGSARNVDVVVLNAAFQDVQLVTNENSLLIPIDETEWACSAGGLPITPRQRRSRAR